MNRTLVPDTLVQYYFKKCGIEVKPLSYFKQNPIIIIKNDETPIVIEKSINELPLKKNNLEVHEVNIAKDIDIDNDITVITDSTTQETIDEFMKEVEKEKEIEVELVSDDEVDEELIFGSDEDDEEDEEIYEESTEESYEEKIINAVEHYGILIYSYIDNFEPHKLFSNKINRQKFYDALKKVCLETTNHFMFQYGKPDKEKGIKFNSFEPDDEHFAKIQEFILRCYENHEANQKKEFEQILAEKKAICGLFRYESFAYQYFYLWDQYAKKYLSPFRYNKLNAVNKDKLSKYVQALIL